MTGLFAVKGRLAALDDDQRARIADRGRVTDSGVEREVAAIIADVRRRGDEALRELAARFDGAVLRDLEVPRGMWAAALSDLDPAVRQALEQAARSIALFHRAQLPATLEVEPVPGLRLGRRADPLGRVGVYAPGGRAAYPSSVLMGVVPAKVAGVGEVIVCSPPGPGGLPPAAVLAACALAGADRVFAVGGAGAVAALALGTRSVPRVDKVVGPGNAWVTEAKRQLNGVVAIDTPAGPSEVLVLADDTADPTRIAVELLAQAEHDPDAAAVLVATDAAVAAAVEARVGELLPAQPRADIIRDALRARGAILTAGSIDEAVRFAAAYAPEHLMVATAAPRALLPSLRSAGTIFLGTASSVAFGDYLTGANHVLPTGGLARAASGLSTLDFIRWTTYQELDDEAAAGLAGATATLADAEGLPAHALAARLRAGPPERRSQPRPAVRLRDAYGQLGLYDPGRSPCETDLSDNTNLFGPPPSLRATPLEARGARGAAAAAPPRESDPAQRLTRYPSVYAAELKAALAAMLGVEPENIATGCGSDDVIDSALRAFTEPGGTVAHPDPTFGMIPAFARMNGLRPVAVPLAAGFALDATALLAARADVTYLCRPNNPTGTAFERAAAERVCSDAAGLVLVDEAYADFADDDLLRPALASGRTVVLRTLSKAWGLAGLRVGYAAGPADLIAELEKSRGPYKVGGVAEAAALAALRADRGWVEARVADVRRNRERLRGELQQRGLRTWPTAANFVLAAVPGRAAEWNGRLRALGVAVRPFPAVPGAGDCLRITVGPWPMMERLLAAVDAILTT